MKFNHKYPKGCPGPSGIEQCIRCGQKRKFAKNGGIFYEWPDGTWRPKRPHLCIAAVPAEPSQSLLYGDSLIVSDGVKAYFNLK